MNDRIATAEILQRSMLTDLPTRPGLELAAIYHPAHAGDQIGGDWYDAFALPSGDTVLVIGDVTGHDITAATIMAQLRSMLRVLAVDRPGSPADLLARLDHAATTLDMDTTATMIVAAVTPAEAPGGARITWSNAGHPAPLLISPNGTASTLFGRSVLIGTRDVLPRQTYAADLPTGSTVILYTDGLVETRGHVITDSIEKLRRRAEDLGHLPLPELLDTLVTDIAGPSPSDDVAVLGCRIIE